MNILKAIFGNEPLSTLLGIGIGALQAVGSHSVKQYAIGLGVALLGRVTNEVQAKFGAPSQSGFARLPLIGGLVAMLVAAPAFAGVSKFVAKHVVKPAAHTSAAITKHTAKAGKKVLF